MKKKVIADSMGERHVDKINCTVSDFLGNFIVYVKDTEGTALVSVQGNRRRCLKRGDICMKLWRKISSIIEQTSKTFQAKEEQHERSQIWGILSGSVWLCDRGQAAVWCMANDVSEIGTKMETCSHVQESGHCPLFF